MTQEDKELLLKDLCARLPYGVFCDIYNDTCTIKEKLLFGGISHFADDKICVRPYLRPMSSMTKEEDKEWQYYKNKIAESCDELLEDKINQCHDFFNAHHLDFRNLIERGLAIDCTGLNVY